jgi:2-polyprenyl-3-methyl-5-hydroxy-6-metoxy-1,4-benzoquinol methylase
VSDRRWRDGSEDRIAGILRAATDRSSGSDELAAHIDDWPTRYHFGRARTNLLHPIHLGPGVRVLDVGAGSGVNSRWAAEQGATVVAVEGDALRAEAAALRCTGLDVDVRHGSATDLADDEGFDVVLCIGVLEYAGDDPDRFLSHLAGLLRPGGALVVAIENRFGLAYWLQADEDHLGQAFVGLEGYPPVVATEATATVRTFSRPELAERLTSAGLFAQRWYQPFPDYKLPGAILTDRCFDQPDAVDLVDQLVGPPIDRSRMGGRITGDERAIHRQVVAAGMGTEMANSFLVVAATDKGVLDRRSDGDTLAWRFTGDRRRAHLRVRRITDGGVRRIDRRAIHRTEDGGRAGSWLHLRSPGGTADDYTTGPNLEQVALDRLRAGDIDGVRTVLATWWTVAHRSATGRQVTDEEVHPFLPAGSRTVLPGDHLDLGLDNLVGPVEHPAEVLFVDDEWEATGGVDRDLAAMRTCWKLATAVVSGGTRHPWPTSTTVDKMAAKFYDLLPDVTGDPSIDHLHVAEAALRVEAIGGDIATHVAQLRAVGRRSVADRTVGDGHRSALRRRLATLKRLPGGELLATLVRRLR